MGLNSRDGSKKSSTAVNIIRKVGKLVKKGTNDIAGPMLGPRQGHKFPYVASRHRIYLYFIALYSSSVGNLVGLSYMYRKVDVRADVFLK